MKSDTNLASNGLSPGEEILGAAGLPALTWFGRGDPKRPLILFVPGVRHLARIAYGAHEGARAEDFLAHHFGVRGFSFAGVSYPTDPAEGGIPTAHPGFTVRDWGRMLADVAGQLIAREGLGREVWVMTWSMSGKVAQSAHVAMREAGLTMPGLIAVTATAPLPGFKASGGISPWRPTAMRWERAIRHRAMPRSRSATRRRVGR